MKSFVGRAIDRRELVDQIRLVGDLTKDNRDFASLGHAQIRQIAFR